jgi:hypothetical protein
MLNNGDHVMVVSGMANGKTGVVLEPWWSGSVLMGYRVQLDQRDGGLKSFYTDRLVKVQAPTTVRALIGSKPVPRLQPVHPTPWTVKTGSDGIERVRDANDVIVFHKTMGPFHEVHALIVKLVNAEAERLENGAAPAEAPFVGRHFKDAVGDSQFEVKPGLFVEAATRELANEDYARSPSWARTISDSNETYLPWTNVDTGEIVRS